MNNSAKPKTKLADRASTASTMSSSSSSSSDSGLSGVDLSEATPSSSAAPSRAGSKSPATPQTIKKKQESLEIIAGDEMSSMRLSSPSRSSTADSRRRSGSSSARHAHFADDLERARGVSSPALSAPPTNGYRASRPLTPSSIMSHAGSLPESCRLRKSCSIPVHLTVSKEDSSELPYSLRPDCFCEVSALHEPSCGLVTAARRANVCPRAASYDRASAASSSAGSVGSADHKRTNWSTARPRVGPQLPPPSTLPRRGNKPAIVSNGAKTTSNVRAANANNARPAAPQQPRPVKPTSAATSFYKATSSSNGRISAAPNRRPLSAANHKYPVAVNASLEIWEIQRELKRGEMVQGVLQLGPRVHKNEEACICAPVTIGRTDGSMHWRSM